MLLWHNSTDACMISISMAVDWINPITILCVKNSSFRCLLIISCVRIFNIAISLFSGHSIWMKLHIFPNTAVTGEFSGHSIWMKLHLYSLILQWLVKGDLLNNHRGTVQNYSAIFLINSHAVKHAYLETFKYESTSHRCLLH